MSRKHFNIEITLIYFLLLMPWPHTHITKLFCSKDNSRLVRKIVRSKWTPILDKYSAKLPLECPLHPLRDVFSPCQDAKKRDRPTQWTCRLCGKSFYQERFLDLHFETRHKSVINEAEDAVCLADFCDIMRCEVFQSEESASLTASDQHVVTDIEVWGDSLGQNAALAKANSPYLSLIPLRTSSIGGRRASRARQLCQDKIGQNKFKDTVENVIIAEKRKQTTKTTIANEPLKNIKKGHADGKHSTGTPTNTDHNKNAANTQTPPHTHNSKAKKKNANDRSSQDNDEDTLNATGHIIRINYDNGNAQKNRSSCKAEELSKLRAQCEVLLRSCISGLLLTMTDQSFKEMEEAMNKAVCWYLSCDRYWEDGPLEKSTFPWGLALILILVLSTGVCFCYYIIWILFNSEETTINTNQHDYMYHRYQQSVQMPHQQQQHPNITGTSMHSGMRQNMSQPYYYQQQPVHELYPEQLQYDYRHSPRRYMTESHTPSTSTAADMAGTPRHRHAPTQSHVYQQDILDRRDYTSRPIATTAVTSVGGKSMGSAMSGAPKSASTAGLGSSGVTMLDGESGMALAAGGGGRHYNTHPRQLSSHHRNSGASQHSLRASSSIHEFMQNDIGQNEHYIYVTYPPDLKKRYFDKYE
uniref:C2H2-type domain-containing protein n=2 Tax=Ceratitis capitata TaxID=7213 RepID=W8BJT2_CERCA